MPPSRLRAIALAAMLLVAPGAVLAQGTGDSGQDQPNLREELDRALREMMDRMKPALDEFRDIMEVFKQIDSIDNYDPPEILPNGDIIIRRRDDAPPWPPEDNPAPFPGPEERGVRT